MSTNSNVVELVAGPAAAEMPKPILPSGLIALTGIAAYFRIAADPTYLKRELALSDDECHPDDIRKRPVWPALFVFGGWD